MIKDIFDPRIAGDVTDRIRALGPDTRPAWGKMNVGQMLAHCCVPYEMVYEDKHPKAGPVTRFLLRTFVKPGVVGEKPYRRNTPTAPAFKITEERDFVRERDRLIQYVERTAELGRAQFEGRESPSFGPLTGAEWNTLFYKHLDHHLTQFGV
jgi:hypothetical protein